jgi:hypothetical protein
MLAPTAHVAAPLLSQASGSSQVLVCLRLTLLLLRLASGQPWCRQVQQA